MSCVCLSVRLQAGIVSKRLDESTWVLACRPKLRSTCPTLCYMEMWVSPKIRVLPSEALSQTQATVLTTEFQFGQKSFDSIRFGNLINLPLVH